MKKLLVWSGGMDSTAILIDFITRKIEFDTVYIELKNNKNKILAELESRKNIVSLFKEKKNVEWKDQIFGAVDGWTLPLNCQVKLIQPFVWILELILNIESPALYDEIYFGYILHDDFWHHKTEIINIFNSCWNFIFPNTTPPIFKFPLEYYKKYYVYTNYYGGDFKDVFNLIWTCEEPKIYSVAQLTFNVGFLENEGKFTTAQRCLHCETCKKFDVLLNEIKENKCLTVDVDPVLKSLEKAIEILEVK